MARILLVRHATTAATGRLLCGRLPGYHLSPDGQRQAQRLGERLQPLSLAAIYASPLERTWETAEAIAQHRRGVAGVVREHQGLLEVDYGDWSGRSLGSLRRLQAWRTVVSSPSRLRFPGGESLGDAQRRAVAVCEELSQRHRERTVGLVTHADIIKAMVSHYLGQPLDLFNRLAIAPASVSVLELPVQGPARLIALNTNGDPTTWQ
jgi:probable phosphoglycerate mutase